MKIKAATKSLPTYAALCLLPFLNAQCLAADFITPISYTATPGESGSYNYFDDTGLQLIDSVIGDNNWQADLGAGKAYEWVGWRVTDPTMNFTFSSTVKISQILIGVNRADGNRVSLPKTVTINGKLFTLKGTEVANGKRGWLKFNGPFTGPTVNITLAHGGDYFIFVDEIQFIPYDIKGTVSWGTAHTVTCQNITQNKTVTIPKTKVSAWDCEKSGLPAKSGDAIRVTIDGTKY